MLPMPLRYPSGIWALIIIPFFCLFLFFTAIRVPIIYDVKVDFYSGNSIQIVFPSSLIDARVDYRTSIIIQGEKIKGEITNVSWYDDFVVATFISDSRISSYGEISSASLIFRYDSLFEISERRILNVFKA